MGQLVNIYVVQLQHCVYSQLGGTGMVFNFFYSGLILFLAQYTSSIQLFGLILHSFPIDCSVRFDRKTFSDVINKMGCFLK